MGYTMHMGLESHRKPRGLSIIETIILLGVVVVAVTGALSIFIMQQAAERLTEERRLASFSATQKIDEIRIFLQNGKTLDQAFIYYGPLPLPTGGPGATHLLTGLYDAKLDHMPVLAICGQAEASVRGGSYQQEPESVRRNFKHDRD